MMLKEMFQKGKIYPSRLNFSIFPKTFPPAERDHVPASVAVGSQHLLRGHGRLRVSLELVGRSLSLQGVLKLRGSGLLGGN